MVFARSNDITPQRAIAPEDLLRVYRKFVERVRTALPEVPIYYIAITPSPSRWAVWNVARRANELIEDYSLTVDVLYVIDITSQLLAPDGKPDPRYYQADGLHMSEAGYEIWAREIRGRLLRDLGAGSIQTRDACHARRGPSRTGENVAQKITSTASPDLNEDVVAWAEVSINRARDWDCVTLSRPSNRDRAPHGPAWRRCARRPSALARHSRIRVSPLSSIDAVFRT